MKVAGLAMAVIRSIRISLCLFVLLLTLPVTGLAAQESSDAITGIWEVEDGTGRIEIHRCETRYCGRIVWISEPVYPAGDRMAGKPLLDRENPKKELRSRPQLGLRIMEGYTWRGNNLWDDGTIYNTENGRSYKSSLSLKSPDLLKLRAYVGISLFGGSTVWKRVRAK